MIRIILATLLVACASPRPAAVCPGDERGEPAVPAEDAALVRWKQIGATKDKAPPEGTTAASLVPELVAYLSSLDPVRRDQIGYEVLATWIGTKRLSADETRALMRTLIANLEGPLDAPVFGRSFSALVLAEVARLDRKEPFLTDAERASLLRAARAYAERETDLRGYTGATGWAHAAAHTGDLLAQLAQSSKLTAEDRAQILDAVAALVARKHGHRLGHAEDSRLAPSVIVSAKAGLAPEAITAFVAKLRAPLVEKGMPAFEPGLYYAQRNARDLLFTLYVYGTTAKEPTPGEAALFAAVTALIEE
jgi:hypothetical protein